MTSIVDTSFLLALTSNKDRNHQNVINFLQVNNDPWLIPTVVFPEVCYLIRSRIGNYAINRFLNQMISNDAVLLPLTLPDLRRVTEILAEYNDSQLDFVDAAIIAMAERENITRIFTLDRRDFSIIRPRHCDYFEIFP